MFYCLSCVSPCLLFSCLRPGRFVDMGLYVFFAGLALLFEFAPARHTMPDVRNDVLIKGYCRYA